MSNKVSKIVNNAEEVIEEAVTTVADVQTENVTTDVVPTEVQPVMEVTKQNPVVKTWNWIKKHPWTVVSSVGAGLAVIVLGKKIYDAGMPAEFDVPTSVADDVIEQPTEHNEVEVKEAQVSEEE